MLKPKRQVTEATIDRLRRIIQDGWQEKSELLIPGDVDEGVVMSRMLNAEGYLEIYDDVMILMMAFVEEN